MKRKRPEGSYYVWQSIKSAWAGKFEYRWSVYKAVTAGGDRWVCDASSERTARQIAKALNKDRAQ